MSIALICPNRDMQDWVMAFQINDPTVKIDVWPEIDAPEEVEFAVCWNHPDGVLKHFPNLKCISSLGAGTEHLHNDPSRPPDIPLVRIVDYDLKQSMAEYVMLGVLNYFRRFNEYRKQQERGKWNPLPIPHISEVNVGVMGCGALGQFVVKRLVHFGFKVCCWSRRRKHLDGMRSYTGPEEFDAFLGKANILVCMLALTPETENIINGDIFNRLPPKAYLINVSRGAHLVDDDLVSALDSGRLSGALLDVFREEPLPKEHPFWRTKGITITPHIASITNPKTAAKLVLENYRRCLAGEPLLNQFRIK